MKFRRCAGGASPLLLAFSVLATVGGVGTAHAQVPLGPPPAETASLGQIVDVRVEGNQRLSSAAFFRLTTLRTGQPYDPVILQRQFRVLWDSRMFDDVWVEALDSPGGKVVVIHVVERPVVLQVSYAKSPVVSNTAIEDRLREKNIVINLNEPVDQEQLRTVEEEIKRLHEEKGHLGTEVRTEVEDTGLGGQAVRFTITPGAKTLIKKINFTGNSVFSGRALKGLMENTMETGFRGMFSSKDLYHPLRFAQDLEAVRNAYQARGRIDVQIKPPIVEFLPGKQAEWLEKERRRQEKLLRKQQEVKPPPDNEGPKKKQKRLARAAKEKAKLEKKAAKRLPPKREAVIVVPVEEGPEYRVGQVTVSGHSVFDAPSLIALVPLHSGDVFDVEALRRGLDNIEALYGQRGYFYATTNREIQRQGGTVADVDVAINEGEQYTLRRIEFAGNPSTKDGVLRRELALAEGDVFNSRLWQIGLTRINQLGYWALSREPEITPVRGAPELEAKVTGAEQGRNQIQVGGGFSGVEGAFFQGSYSTRNFLGRGEILQSSVQVGGRSQNVNLSFTEPFFLGSRNTVGASIFSQRIEFGDFTRSAQGYSLLFGQRLGNFSSYAVTYRNERFDEAGGFVFFFDINSLPAGFENLDAGALFRGEFGTPIPQGLKTVNSTLVPVFTYNTVNNPFRPSRGLRMRASVELTGSFLGGDNEFIKPILGLTWYRPAFRRSHFAFNLEGAVVRGLSGNLIPRSERFFLGGDVRGPRVFETRSIAPLGPIAGVAPVTDTEGNIIGVPFAEVGGESYFLAQAELVLQVTDPFDIALFFDAGNSFDEPTGFDLGELRYSAGLEARFHLPIFQAPLRLIWGRVLDEEVNDRINSFQFSIGFPF